MINYDFLPTYVFRQLDEKQGQCLDVAIAYDGRCAITSGRDGVVRLWDLKHGFLVRNFRGHERWATLVAVSPDSRFLLSAGHDQTARIWRLPPPKVLLKEVYRQTFRVSAKTYIGDSGLSGEAKTNLRLEKDQKVRFQVSGNWSGAQNKNGLDLLTVAISESGKNAFWVTGGSPEFMHVVEKSGWLFLGITDPFVRDNSGEVAHPCRLGPARSTARSPRIGAFKKVAVLKGQFFP